MTPVPVGPLGPLNSLHLLGDQERALQQRLTRWLHGRAASGRPNDAGRLGPRQTSRGMLKMPGRRTPSRGKVSHCPGANAITSATAAAAGQQSRVGADPSGHLADTRASHGSSADRVERFQRSIASQALTPVGAANGLVGGDGLAGLSSERWRASPSSRLQPWLGRLKP